MSSNGDFNYDPNISDTGYGGLTTGAYTLSLNLGSVLVQEKILNGSPANLKIGSAQPVTGNTVLQGSVLVGSTEYYSFTAATTGSLTATVTPADGTASCRS